jgi:hypothetical protein
MTNETQAPTQVQVRQLTLQEQQAEHAALMQKMKMADHGDFGVWEADVTRDWTTGRIIKSVHGDGDDRGLNVVFTTEKVLHMFKTFEAGGVPQYIDMDFVTITVPGRLDLSVHTPVTPFYEFRFRKEYEAYKSGEKTVMGTDLSKWPHVSDADRKSLNAQGVYTVEQVATLSESSGAAVIRGFFDLRMKAQQFLAAQASPKDAAVNAQLEAQAALIEKLTKQLDTLTTHMEKGARANK